MKRLPLLLLFLAACHQPQDEYAPCTYMFIQPIDLLHPEEYYRAESVIITVTTSPWENSPGWYSDITLFHNDPHGVVRVCYADSQHPGYPDIYTTADSVRYYDSLIGHPSNTVVPAKGALSD